MADDLFAPPGGPAQPDRPSTSAPSGGSVPPPFPPPPPVPAPVPAPPPGPTGGPSPAPGPDHGPGFAAGTHYAPGWQPEPPRTDPLAIASVPAGVVLGPVGIGLGGAALSRVRANGTRGRGLAVAGMVVGAVVTVAWGVGAVAWWQADQARTPLAGDVSEPATVDARRLVVGSCLDVLPPDGEVTRVRVVPCADEHRAQVVARTDFGADEVWPGQAAADARVARVCGVEVLGGNAPDDVELVVWSPTEASWEAGDRTGLCLAASDAPLEDLVG